jgi:hypothetical protein
VALARRKPSATSRGLLPGEGRGWRGVSLGAVDPGEGSGGQVGGDGQRALLLLRVRATRVCGAKCGGGAGGVEVQGAQYVFGKER